MRRLLISGTNSGCGKTTVVCAVLSALKTRGLMPTAFKCGPDYIDPTFHRAASGVPAYNLDPFFLDGDGLRSHLTSRAGALSVIEGAMGYYDGVAATDEASAYTVARETRTPVVLVVSAKGAGNSLGAVIEGFARHRPDSSINGVIFNHANERRYPDLQKIAEGAGVRAYGWLPRNGAWSLPSRRLGLLTAGEIGGLKDTLAELGRQAEQSIDMDGLVALAGTAPALPALALGAGNRGRSSLRVAIARDEAFCFLYAENLELLQSMGCELVFFSPMRDKALPEKIRGLYIGGGYPENYAETLNASMRESVRQAVFWGLPTVAEGGGFLYLHDCGVINGKTYKTERLQRFGYVTLTARRDNLLCRAGESIRAHEFHYWDSDSPGDGFTARKAGRELTYPCVHTTDTLYAGFPHLYFPANPAFAERFVERMSKIETA